MSLLITTGSVVFLVFATILTAVIYFNLFLGGSFIVHDVQAKLRAEQNTAPHHSIQNHVGDNLPLSKNLSDDIIEFSVPYFTAALVKIFLLAVNYLLGVGILATAAVLVTQIIAYDNNKRLGPDTVPTTTAVTAPTIGSTVVGTPVAQRPTTGASGGGIGNGVPSAPFGSEPTGAVARPTNTPTVTPSSTPSPSPTRRPTITPIPTRPPVAVVDASQEQRFFFLLNERRSENNCALLTYSPELNAAARRHAVDRAASGQMMHTGTDGSDINTRVKESGYTNTKRGNGNSGWWTQLIFQLPAELPSPDVPVTSWMQSPEDSNRAAILDCEFRDMGVGYARGSDGQHYWVVILADGVPR